MRQLIGLTIDSADYELSYANNGADALSRIKVDKPDIMLLDIMMPGAIDGFQLCDIIKNDYRYAGIYVILLTSRCHDFDFMEGKRVKCDKYITKPFSPLRLMDEINQAYDKIAFVQ